MADAGVRSRKSQAGRDKPECGWVLVSVLAVITFALLVVTAGDRDHC